MSVNDGRFEGGTRDTREPAVANKEHDEGATHSAGSSWPLFFPCPAFLESVRSRCLFG